MSGTVSTLFRHIRNCSRISRIRSSTIPIIFVRNYIVTNRSLSFQFKQRDVSFNAVCKCSTF
jgi:hypothetical protein